MTFAPQGFELDTGEGADQAATAVGSDQVARPDLRLPVSRPVTQHDAHPVGALGQHPQLGAEADLAAPGEQVLQQDGLELILTAEGDADRADIREHLVGR